MATGFERIISQVGYKKQVLSLNDVRVVVPGLPYTAYDAFELPAPWSVLDVLISAQVSAVYAPSNDDRGSLLQMNTFFEQNISYSITSKVDFYEPLYNKNTIKVPLNIDNLVTHMGKTSIVIDTEMKTGVTSLARCRQHQLCVDKTSKKPVPIPYWLQENYNQHCNPGEPIRFTVLGKPSIQSHVTRVSIGRVQYSDIDPNFHLNFSNYLKYCINGIFKRKMSVSEPGRPPQPLRVKSAFMWFRKECYLGDSLDIEFWNHKTKSSAICVDMLKDNNSVFQCILEFYDTEKLKSAL